VTPGQLADREMISDLVIAYALALDTRDWALLASILTDRVGIDYSSHAPELVFDLPATEWVAMVTNGLSGFDVTQHLSTNHIITLDGGNAVCRSQMQARHVLTLADGTYHCTLFGHYYSRCVRSGDGWKIAHKTLVLTGHEGDQRVFGWAPEKWNGARA
jgi:3-phenylpropionate/cinnamic acid dioxygenase small subunit